MADDFLEMKKLVINELVGRMEQKDKEDLAAEFGLAEERLEELVKKLLDRWLTNPDFIVMVATALGLSLPRKTKERRAHYIG